MLQMLEQYNSLGVEVQTIQLKFIYFKDAIK